MPQDKVPLVSPLSRIQIDAWGEAFLERHFPELLRGPGPLPIRKIVDIILPRDYGIDVGVADMTGAVEGICEPPDRLTLRSDVYDGLDGSGPDRFTGAHEVVHAIGHLPQLNARYESSVRVPVYRRSRVRAFEDPEWQANRGAAALLMPASVVWQLLQRWGNDPSALVDAFGVSVTAARFRIDDALNNRLLTPAQSSAVAARRSPRWPGL